MNKEKEETTGIVFDIHYNALYDGPGIRTMVFFKGCPLRCEWCHNPESHRREPQVTYFAEKCLLCGECAAACPEKAIEFTKKAVIRNEDKCAACGKCVKACPGGALEMAGMRMKPSEIAEKAARDKPFYDNSGGGVTISGGEATAQPAFLLDTLDRIRERGIQTALETCGFFPLDLVDSLILRVDLFLFDLKHIDDEKHKRHTGVSNRKIHDNFMEIRAKAGAERLVPRIPLIPDFNTSPEDIRGFIEFLKDSGHPGPVHLMPYNPFAKTKWEKVGRGSEYRKYRELPEEELQEIIQAFEAEGFGILVNR